LVCAVFAWLSWCVVICHASIATTGIYHAGRGILCRVDATGTIDQVTARVFAAVDHHLTAAT
jgi:hypothetical protein